MKPLGANMKIFLQMKIMYLWYFIMLMQLPGMLIFTKTNSQMVVFSPAILAMLLGITVAGLLKDVNVCPVTFCLPAQAKVPVKVILIWGCVAPALLLAVRLFVPGVSENPLYGPLAPFAAVEAFIFAFYFICAALIYINDFTGRIGYFGASVSKYKWNILDMNLAGIAFPVLVFSVMLGGSQIAEYMIKYPLQVTAICCALSFYCAGKLTSSARRRDLCGKQIISSVQGWNPSRNAGMLLADFAEKNRAGDKIASAEKMFTAFAARAETTLGRLTAGYMYNMVDCIGIRFWQTIFSPILVLVIWGYCFANIPNADGINPGDTVLCMVYIFPAIGALLWALPMHASLHVPAGRKDKFTATLVSTMALTITGTLLIGAVVVIDKLIAPYMPASLTFLPYRGDYTTFNFATPSLEYLWVTPATMPVGFAFGALFGRGGLIRMMLVPIVIIAEELAITWLEAEFGLHGIIPVSAVALGWLFYIWALHRLCFKKAIAGPGRD